MAGNAVEVQESIDAPEGRGPKDLMEVTLALGAELVASAKTCDITAAKKLSAIVHGIVETL
jgi:thymidine phosphorylase